MHALRQLDTQHDFIDARGQGVQRSVLAQPENPSCFAIPQHQAVCSRHMHTPHDSCTMHQFMWQADLVGVAHFVKECFAMLDAQA